MLFAEFTMKTGESSVIDVFHVWMAQSSFQASLSKYEIVTPAELVPARSAIIGGMALKLSLGPGMMLRKSWKVWWVKYFDVGPEVMKQVHSSALSFWVFVTERAVMKTAEMQEGCLKLGERRGAIVGGFSQLLPERVVCFDVSHQSLC